MNLEKLKQVSEIAKQIQMTDIQSFILKNQKNFESNLLYEIANQYISRQKAKHKLPTWFANQNVIFPPILSVEQASSEITANYKTKIFFDFITFINSEANAGRQFHCGLNPVSVEISINLQPKSTKQTCIDLTGGMGLDSFALSNVFDKVIYVEQNPFLCEIAKYNFEVLGQKNIEVINENSTSLNQSFFSHSSNFYLDPHRRDSAKNKVFKIEDCEPNILAIKHLFENYMVKFSPMLDIKLALEQLGGTPLQNISQVHVVAVENEVKELLFLGKKTVEKAERYPTVIHCVNFLPNHDKQTFKFDYESEQKARINYSKPSKYIYEPNATILKAGAFKSIANYHNINKLAPSSHLYTSDVLVENFAGRSFICEAVCKFDKKEILAQLPDNQANISTRNFPLKPEEIKKKLGLRDGGEYYLFATENYEKQKIVLICKKVTT
jgi:hypothetical protein